MKSFTVRLCVFTMLFALVGALGTAWAQGAEEEAVKAAVRWLELADAGDYDESWDAAAASFKKAIKQDAWNQAMVAFRRPLGDVVSRELKSAEYLTSMLGAPDGEYVVIQFSTSFTNKSSAVETVTPMRTEDGTWRVSGYFIK